MRVAVYTIALNEEQFVERWARSAADADVRLVADTGSSDRTVERLRELGVTCHSIVVKPWRFDDARNVSLALIPGDIDFCIVLDMDEVLAPGWRPELERCFAAGANRLRSRYVWSHNPDGSDGLTFFRDGIHARHGYRWIHPVHEVLQADRIEERMIESTITTHHWPDGTKPRTQYLSLLEQSIKEDPDDDRNAHYYARELMFAGRLEDAAREFKRHLSLPRATWPAERCTSYRYLARCEPHNGEGWLHQACAEDPGRREAFVDLARWYYERQLWDGCLRAAEMATYITQKPLDYMCEAYAWGADPWDYAAIAAYHLGKKERAKEYGQKALSLRPNDPRLIKNMEFY